MIQTLRNLKAIVTDVDGVLTDGTVTLDANGQETKTFSVADGQLLRFARSKGLVFGVISGRASHALNHRLDELKFEFRATGSKNKEMDLDAFCEKLDIAPSEILYIGDDLPDLQVARHVGVFACPSDASLYVKQQADLITEAEGGKGVLRDVIELWVRANGLESEMIEFYSDHV